MRGSRKFCQKGSNCDHFFVFVFDEGKEDSNTTISRDIIGPPAKVHLNDVSLAGR